MTSNQSAPGTPAIPRIPLPPLLASPCDPAIAQALLNAFTSSGFLYLCDLEPVIPASLLTAVFSHSISFFARPQDEKDRLAWTIPDADRGYSRMGLERLSVGKTKEEVDADRGGEGEDMKESFEIGREDGVHENRWLEGEGWEGDREGQAFGKVMRCFFEKCHDVHIVLMRTVAVAMGLLPTFFDDYIGEKFNTLRLLHYPALPRGSFEGGRKRAGAHYDYGSITLLFQDMCGGLQVEQPGGGFTDVDPIAGTVVVNAGDLLARWSNGLIRSTKHRVVGPPKRNEQVGGANSHPPRYSIAYFCAPDPDRLIDALPGTWEEKLGGKRYDAVQCGHYLLERLRATY